MKTDKTCQSCGMPMTAVEHFGTNSDKSAHTEYCCFCFRDGVFTDHLDLDEFVEDSIRNYDGTDSPDGYLLTRDELALKERIRLSGLKRWASRHTTHQEYFKSVNRVITYINDHLDQAINLNDLSGVAHISGYHFHRIFKAILNESPGEYIQRLRLEKAVFLLQTSTYNLTEIAERTGYHSSPALSKAFRKKFTVSPAVFRSCPAELTTPMKEPIRNTPLHPQVLNIGPKEVVYTRVTNPFHSADAFQEAWRRLLRFTRVNGIPDEQHEYLCVSHDITTITHPDHYRLYACISVPQTIRPKGQFGVQTIKGGMYAVFRHQGPYKNLDALYCNIYRYWIPNSNYRLRDSLHFEKYLNNPDLVDDSELMTDIYIPVGPVGTA